MKIALVQARLAWGNVERNLKEFGQRVETCNGCGLILLPEMFVSGCMMVKQEKSVAVAEKIKIASYYEEVKDTMLRWASRQGAVVAGSTVYVEDGRYYNRMLVAFPDGKYLYYDKRHCFRMGGENEHFTAGSESLVFEYEGVKIAAFICYDLRFPVWCRNTQDYDLAVFVANWPESRREIWQTLLRARAIENQAFVAGVNCVGEDPYGLRYAGDSVVLNARGEVLGACRESEEEVVCIEIDIEELCRFREKFPVLDDRDHFMIESL